MNLLRLFTTAYFFSCFALATAASAAIDNDASIVKLRTSCTEGGAALNNCFSEMSSLITWINSTRMPSQDAPLSVEVGPGTFGGFSCSFTDVSFRGAGRDITTIGAPNQGAIYTSSTSICSRLHVQDLTVTGGFPAPVYWSGGGSSTWVNVRLKGGLYGWSETNCQTVTASTRPVHRWFSSSIEATGKVAYAVQCSENWFYGSEIINKGSGFLGGLRGITARSALASDRPEVHVYGSVIRVIPNAGISFSNPSAAGDATGVIAVAAGADAEIHIHGTGIDVLGNDMPNNVGALAAHGGGMIHADSSAFNMKTAPGGQIVRITNDGGHVHAPYLWQHIPGSPLASETGSDMSTITTGTSDGHPHSLIYDTSCSSTWYDTVDKACKP